VGVCVCFVCGCARARVCSQLEIEQVKRDKP
jgi:hypothetical protein